MSLELYLAYIAACIVIMIVPGPTVTLIVANALRFGTRAGLLNVLGTQLGFAIMMLIVLAGLASVVEAARAWFEALRFLGAAYLIWLGVGACRAAWRSRGADGSLQNPQAQHPQAQNPQARKPRGGFFLQGFLVLMSNPKILLLFGAFIPQFIDPKTGYASQIALLGATAMVVAAIFDSLYAILAGRAGARLSQTGMRILSGISGLVLIGGGLWMALLRAR
jgi:homoserine/homoserine lactone efflux protein